jgi:hypothetical protein
VTSSVAQEEIKPKRKRRTSKKEDIAQD